MLKQVLDSKWKAVHLYNRLCGVGSCVGWSWVFFQLGYSMSSCLPDWAPNLV